MELGILGLLLSFVILIYSAILHEIAHGWVADRLGDPTARISGRLTLNPLNHIDLFMSIILPVFLYIYSQGQFIFGGAKPVPVDPFNLKDGRKDTAIVALAGPLTNLLIAVIASLILRLLVFFSSSSGNFFILLIYSIGSTIVQINILLALFNLLPVPPLDGSKVFAMLLPEKEARSYLSIGQFGIILLMFLLFYPIGPFSLSSFLTQLLTLTHNLLLP